MTTNAPLAYAPALDGLRALCLLAVLFFHSGFAWMPGGFLGVSTFFTLSGFLITSLLLAEHQRDGRVSVGTFWARRLRRLTPAALLTIGAVVATGPLWLTAPQRERLAGDTVAALFYVVNWQFVRAEYAYGLIFTAPSPLQHFWSLAIEAQFYLLWPLVVGLLLRVTTSTRVQLAVVAALVLASAASGFAPTSVDQMQYRLYYGTDARAAEILVGSLLAIAARGDARLPAPLLSALGGGALLGVVLCWGLVHVGDGALYQGGFALYALLSATIVAASTRTHGFLPTLLSRPWLRWLGKVSYGAYLYHWPVFLVLDEGRTGLGAAPLLGLRLAVTLLLAGASYRFVEEPIRRGRMLAPPWFGRVTAGSFATIGLLAIVTSPIGLAARWEDLAGGTDASSHDDRVSRGPERRFAVFGDSMAYTLWPGIAQWVRRQPGKTMVKGVPTLGCGVFDSGQVDVHGHWIDTKPTCGDILAKWRASVEEERPDIAIVLTGSWETRDWRQGAGEPRRALGEPVFDARASRAIGAAMDALLGGARRVVWLGVPPLRQRRPKGSREPPPPVDPARVARLNQLIREQAALRAPRVVAVDFGAALERWPGGALAPDLRPDGVHFLDEAARELVETIVGEEIVRAASGSG